MASALFKVRVLEVTSATVRVRLFIVHPDQFKFYRDKTFALQLLWDCVHPVYAIESELGKAISLEQILDVDFVVGQCDQFVQSVGIEDLKNYPRDVDFNAMSDAELTAYWKNEAGLPQATLSVTATDPKWVAHLRPGMEWETTAYEM